MKKILIFVVLLCSIFSLSAAALELQGITVDGNYWFGASKGFLGFGEIDSKHNSVNVAASASFSPSLVLDIDYTYGKYSHYSINGELLTIPEGIDLSESHQLMSAALGYTKLLSPALSGVVSLGLGAYKFVYKSEEDSDWASMTVKTLRPQIGLAVQYQATPQFSLRSNVASFLGNEGEILLEGDIGGPGSFEAEMNFCRWQIEGQYLFQGGWEAVAGYRAWAINSSDEGNDLEAKGFYLGTRYSF